jgi:hypothetical protein
MLKTQLYVKSQLQHKITNTITTFDCQEEVQDVQNIIVH